MSYLWDKTPERAVEFALETLLTKGFESEFYDNWQQFAVEDYEENLEDLENYNLRELQAAWEAMITYVKKNNPVLADNGVSVTWVANHEDGEATSTDAYFVVFRIIEDNSGDARYFMHEGHYQSYYGGRLDEGTSREVFPKQKTITVWRSEL